MPETQLAQNIKQYPKIVKDKIVTHSFRGFINYGKDSFIKSTKFIVRLRIAIHACETKINCNYVQLYIHDKKLDFSRTYAKHTHKYFFIFNTINILGMDFTLMFYLIIRSHIVFIFFLS